MDANGFLTSQVGYDLGDPKRAHICSYKRDYVTRGTQYQILPIAESGSPGPAYSGEMRYWGETWNAHWWEIDSSDLEQPGTYTIAVQADGNPLYTSDPIEIGDNLLWERFETWANRTE